MIGFVMIVGTIAIVVVGGYAVYRAVKKARRIAKLVEKKLEREATENVES